MKPKTKFKVGDKVRILPSARDVMVHPGAVGMIGEVLEYDKDGMSIQVCMDKPRIGKDFVNSWTVDSSQIELVVLLGQQLLLWNDIWEKEV